MWHTWRSERGGGLLFCERFNLHEKTVFYTCLLRHHRIGWYHPYSFKSLWNVECESVKGVDTKTLRHSSHNSAQDYGLCGFFFNFFFFWFWFLAFEGFPRVGISFFFFFGLWYSGAGRGTSLSIVRPRRQGRSVHTILGGQSIRPRTHDRMCSGLPIRNAVMIWRNQIPITDTDNFIPELTIWSDCIYSTGNACRHFYSTTYQRIKKEIKASRKYWCPYSDIWQKRPEQTKKNSFFWLDFACFPYSRGTVKTAPETCSSRHENQVTSVPHEIAAQPRLVIPKGSTAPAYRPLILFFFFLW